MSLKLDYQNRKEEIQAHLDFIQTVENHISNSREILVTGLQQKILNASFFIHLYSLIESTLALCILEVENIINNHHISEFSTFKACIQKLWIKHYFRLNNSSIIENETSSLEKRIDFTHDAYRKTLDKKSLFRLKIKEKLGTVDNTTFDNVARKLDLQLIIPDNIKRKILTKSYDGKNALEMIRTKRDKLAHGELSYSDVNDDYSYEELKDLFDIVCDYLDFVVEAFEKYISEEGYKLKEEVVEVEKQ